MKENKRMDSYVNQLVKDKIFTGIMGRDETFDIIKNTIQIGNTPSSLDVGAAGGSLALTLSDTIGGNIVSIDKNSLMAEATKNRIASFSTKGKIDVRCIDVFDEALDSTGPFDVIAFRGFQSFVKQPTQLVSRVFDLLKPWGYLINITQTYENKADQGIIDEINDQIGTFIKKETVSDIATTYTAAGFRRVLIHQLPKSVVETQCIALSNTKLKDLFCKNDRQTSAFVMIFRKPSIIELGTNDLCKN